MDTTQLNKINKILVADCKSFVLLEVEKLAGLGKFDLNLPNGIYQFCIFVLEYRNILTEYNYNLINKLWKESEVPEPANDLVKPSFLSKSKTVPIALINKGGC